MNILPQKLSIYVDVLLRRYPRLELVKEDIINAYILLESCYLQDGKLLIAGNGGSAADAEHIAGELMKRFRLARTIPKTFAKELRETNKKRGDFLAHNLEQVLMALPLVSHTALSTAYINDVNAPCVFAQQLYGFGRPGDVFLGISTSGKSENILNAAVVARTMGIRTIGLTGIDGGELAEIADVSVKVPEKETFMIQELHLPVYHCWCMMLEERFFGI